MKRIVTAGTLTLALTLVACAAKQPPAPPPLNLVTEAPPKPEATPAAPTGAQLLDEQRPEVQQAIKKHQQNGKGPIYKTAESTLYPYNERPEPADCEPLRMTDIQLQPGETITDVAIGDTRTPVPRGPIGAMVGFAIATAILVALGEAFGLLISNTDSAAPSPSIGSTSAPPTSSSRRSPPCACASARPGAPVQEARDC